MWKTAALFFLNRAMALFLGELWLFIQSAVALYQKSEMTSEQKREAVILDAFLYIKEFGLQCSHSLVNLGIEAAVQNLKEKK